MGSPFTRRHGRPVQPNWPAVACRGKQVGLPALIRASWSSDRFVDRSIRLQRLIVKTCPEHKPPFPQIAGPQHRSFALLDGRSDLSLPHGWRLCQLCFEPGPGLFAPRGSAESRTSNATRQRLGSVHNWRFHSPTMIGRKLLVILIILQQ